MSSLSVLKSVFKRAWHLMSVLCLLLACQGCTHTRNNTQTGPNGQRQIVLQFWNGFTGPDGATMTAMVDQFRKENPDIAIQMQMIPWGTYYDKLTLALAYGGAPDVFIVHAARLPEFASYHTLNPLSQLYSTDGPTLTQSDFAPVPWQATFWQRTQYALPLDTHPLGMYYNRKLFQQAGIVDSQGRAKPPTTLTEFLDDARRLTKDTDGDGHPDQWGFVFTNQRSNWITFSTQFGGSILTPDGKSGALESPQNIQASQLMQDLIYKYKVAPKPEGVDAWLAFRQGKVGMAMEGIYMLASLQQQSGLQFAGAPAPQFGPLPGVWGGSHLLCQPAGISPERSQAAWRFMRFISDHSLTWGQGGQVPARLAVERSAQFQSLPVQSQFARQLNFVHYEPLVPQDNSLFQFVDPAIESVLLHLQTPHQAMQDADRRIDQLLKRS